MRELKFRAWDGFQMIPALEILEGSTSSVFNMYPKPARTHPKAHKFMQYTGLKDKNNVEIYEGDIVKNLDGVLGHIYWDLAMYGWYIGDGLGLYEVDNTDYGLEVIGNVYENSNLLKGDLK